MGNSKSKKKLDMSNTPVNEGRKKSAPRKPPIVTGASKPPVTQEAVVAPAVVTPVVVAPVVVVVTSTATVPTVVVPPTVAAPVVVPPTDAPPVVVPPTDAAPVAVPPTDAAPVVVPPTDAAPVVVPPTDAAPVVVPPTDAAPMVVPPTDAAPVVVPPTDAAPVVVPPTDAAPVVVPPTDAAPVVVPPEVVAPAETPKTKEAVIETTEQVKIEATEEKTEAIIEAPIQVPAESANEEKSQITKDAPKEEVSAPPVVVQSEESNKITKEAVTETVSITKEAMPNVDGASKETPEVVAVEPVVVNAKAGAETSHAAAKVAATKMPIELYYMAPSPPCRAVMLTAKVVGVEFTLKAVNVFEGDLMKEDFLKLNPQHCIPTINDNGFIMWESRAIMAYIANQYGKDDNLYPKSPNERAIVDQRLYFDMGELFHKMAEYYFPVIFAGAPLNPDKLQPLQNSVQLFNTLLDGKTFAAGDHLTLADIALVVTISNIEAFGFDFSPYPNVLAWYDKTKEALAPYGYDEINKAGAETMGDFFKSKLG